MVKPMQLGHANIRVSDLERAEKFYTEALGLHVTRRRGSTTFMKRPRAFPRTGNQGNGARRFAGGPEPGWDKPLRLGNVFV